MREYQLTLVNPGSTALLHILKYVAFLTSIIVLVYFTISQGESIVFISTILWIGCGIYLMHKYDYKLSVKYNLLVKLYEDHFQIDDKQYKWEEIEWYNRLAGGKLFSGFKMAINGKRTPINLYTFNKLDDAFYLRNKLIADILDTIASKSIVTRNYYNTKNWRLLARTLLASNVLLIIGLIVLGYGFNTTLVVTLIWLFISLPMPIIIFMKQEDNDGSEAHLYKK